MAYVCKVNIEVGVNSRPRANAIMKSLLFSRIRSRTVQSQVYNLILVTDQLASFMAFDIKSYSGFGAPLRSLEQGADVGELI